MTEIILILFGALSRLVPHPANFTAIAAIALFGAVRMHDKKQALLIPIAAMLLSDTILEIMFQTGVSMFAGFHSGMFFVYGAFFIISLIGLKIRENVSFKTLAIGTLSGSLIFYLITNFGVWTSGWYGFSFEGLATCYVAAIPFYRNQLMGDVFFTALLFGVDYIVKTSLVEKKAV